MKSLFLALAISPMLIWAQQSSIEGMANFSEADSNRAHVTVSGKAFQLMAKMEIDSTVDETIQRLAQSIDGMEAYMEFTSTTAENMLNKLAKNDDYDEYAAFTQKDEVFKFYVNEIDGVVSEMIMVAKEDGKGYAASVVGKMDMRDIGKLYRLVNMNGFKYLNGGDEE
jgi:hypothetical protein